jgi:hypothetical protein
MVDLVSPKHKGTTQVDKISKKKKQLPEISNANLAAHLKQVSTVNANDSLLQAATKDKEEETKRCPRK